MIIGETKASMGKSVSRFKDWKKNSPYDLAVPLEKVNCGTREALVRLLHVFSSFAVGRYTLAWQHMLRHGNTVLLLPRQQHSNTREGCLNKGLDTSCSRQGNIVSPNGRRFASKLLALLR